MAAPERFAEKSDSSCTAGAVHTWPFSTDAALQADVGFWGTAEIWSITVTALARSWKQ